MTYQLWAGLDSLTVPTVQEVKSQAEKEPILFPEESQIDESFVSGSVVYGYLFAHYFKEKTGLDSLDRRIAEYGIKECPLQEADYYQRYSSLGLKYFYIRAVPRVDRLSKEDMELIGAAAEEKSETSWYEAMSVVNTTFRDVMTVDPQSPDTVFHPLVTWFKTYAVKGGEIPLALKTVPDYDENGNLVSEKAEEKRNKMLDSLSRQLDSALSSDLGCPVRTCFPF